jgi:hypothetical protein
LPPRAFHRHLHRSLGWIRDRDRIVEEHHDAIARELVERSFELANERPEGTVVFPQEVEDLRRLTSTD